MSTPPEICGRVCVIPAGRARILLSNSHVAVSAVVVSVIKSVCICMHDFTFVHMHARVRARIWLCMQMCSQMLIAPARQRGIHPAVQAQCLERDIVAIERVSLRHMGVSCVWMRPCVRARALERACVCVCVCVWSPENQCHRIIMILSNKASRP